MRPVFVLTLDDVIAGASMSSQCPASRTTHGRLAEVELGRDDGMPATCFLIAENTLSTEKIYLTQLIGDHSRRW